MTKGAINFILWTLAVTAAVLTIFAISAAWGEKPLANFGQHLAIVSAIAGPLIIATVVLLVAALITTRTVSDEEAARRRQGRSPVFYRPERAPGDETAAQSSSTISPD